VAAHLAKSLMGPWAFKVGMGWLASATMRSVGTDDGSNVSHV